MAYAKINLYLNITGTRADGYHTLDMIMQEVDLADELTIVRDDALTVECAGVPQEQNLAYRAAQAFFAATGIRGGARIAIQKRIPAQAGMGGGSADAACVLKALNALYDAGLTQQQLAELGVRLGADVPFALTGGCARAEGIGEALTPLKNNLRATYLIVKPFCGVPTGAAFRLADEQRGEAGRRGEIAQCIAALASGDAERFCAHTANDLTAPAIALCPAVRDVLQWMGAQEGCAGAFMTGSGSACVGLFADESLARAAAERVDFAQASCFLTHAT